MKKLIEILTPNEIEDVVAKFEIPLKGKLTGDVKDYVDTLKALAGYVSTNPHKNTAQAKDFLTNYNHDKRLKQSQPGLKGVQEPQQSEPVAFGSQAAKDFQKSDALPSLSSLAGQETDPWQTKAGLPNVPDKEKDADNFVDLTGTRVGATAVKKKPPVRKPTGIKPAVASPSEPMKSTPPALPAQDKEPVVSLTGPTKTKKPMAAKPVAPTGDPEVDNLPDATKFAKLMAPKGTKKPAPQPSAFQSLHDEPPPTVSPEQEPQTIKSKNKGKKVPDNTPMPAFAKLARAQRVAKI
jgi:hypothetical protein